MPRKKNEIFEDEAVNMEAPEEENDILEEPENAEPQADEQQASAAEEVEELHDEESPEVDSVVVESRRMTADVPLQLVAVLGKKTLSMKELLGLKMGQVLDLARPVNEQVDLVAGGKLFARGELVDIDGKLGVRIIKMVR